MADSGSNIIKPVESLQNIPGLTPTRRREHKKHRQQPHEKNKEHSEQEQNNSAGGQDLGSELTENENDRNTIDYCA